MLLLFICHFVHADGQNDEEPTFILTLYEIPVTESSLPVSNNDSVMTSDLSTVETQAFWGFSDQAQSLPSTSESSRLISSGLFYLNSVFNSNMNTVVVVVVIIYVHTILFLNLVE